MADSLLLGLVRQRERCWPASGPLRVIDAERPTLPRRSLVDQAELIILTFPPPS